MFALKRNIPLSEHTTFHIGGPADFYAEASGALEIAQALEYADKHHLPAYILGGGSNVIFPDAGFRGLVIKLQDGGIHIHGDKISAGAGMPLFNVVWAAKDASLAGIESLAGIPGSYGGAVRGNAGAFGTEIGDAITAVKGFDRDTGMIREFKRDECKFTYRSSIFKENPNLLILSADIKLRQGNKEELEQIIKATVAKREKKHPQDAWCAGSFFMNPVVKDEKLRKEFEKDLGMKPKDEKLPAGWLIDHVGLRGKKIGGAMMSTLHPNYLINTGDAKAEDVITLASLVKTRVRDELGVKLKEEVQYVGF